ncbi:MAG: zinc ABC transporter substrate-binding protein [Oscillospiraceae bacterium]|nr:zinc ABC transporter substrate-binding protein [Oscillospiraceae bacterium]
MKKILSITLCLLMLLGVMTGCADEPATPAPPQPDSVTSEQNPTDAPVEKKLNIVTTIFPEYDWVKQILGDQADRADITMLLDNGVDLHSYQPTADDIVKISTCDMFVYVGGESDEWVEDVLAEAQNKDMVVVNLLEVLGDKVKAEEVKEGMEADHDHEHEHEHEEIEEEDIQDRALSEFEGEWSSLIPLLESGALEAYVEHEAEEDGASTDEVLEELAEKWACDAVTIAIDGSTITFTYVDGTSESAEYSYAGYVPVRAEDGDITSVRYQFEADADGAPKYVQFNDHGHEPADEVEHFHVWFGDESFDALLNAASNPFFVPASASSEEVLEELMGGHHHEEEEEESDEHVWLSLRNAAALCDYLSSKLCELDADNAEAYAANTDAYVAKLNALDADYQAAVDAASVKTLLFGDRFPFRYLTDDYGLDYYAAFVGCSAETEASFETIVFLANKVDELGLRAILQIESADGRIAQTIRDTTAAKDQAILTMDSMQSTTSADVANGASYLTIMEQNLAVLAEALK